MKRQNPKQSPTKYHSCICLTCGIRNDHSHPDGLCQNGHDDWLEYRDVFLEEDANSEPRQRAKKIFKMTIPELKASFCNPDIKQFQIKSDKP